MGYLVLILTLCAFVGVAIPIPRWDDSLHPIGGLLLAGVPSAIAMLLACCVQVQRTKAGRVLSVTWLLETVLLFLVFAALLRVSVTLPFALLLDGLEGLSTPLITPSRLQAAALAALLGLVALPFVVRSERAAATA